jgi:hypothetical protein
MAESAVLVPVLFGAVACIIAAIRSKRWLLLLAAIGIVAGVLMRAVWK